MSEKDEKNIRVKSFRDSFRFRPDQEAAFNTGYLFSNEEIEQLKSENKQLREKLEKFESLSFEDMYYIRKPISKLTNQMDAYNKAIKDCQYRLKQLTQNGGEDESNKL